MSINKKAASSLPSDDFTYTDGSNFGLDTFDFDTHQGNRGVLEKARLPEAKGLSRIPDGVIGSPEDHSMLPRGVEKSADEGLGNLTELLSENVVTNYDWFETAIQDPSRLPKEEILGEPQSIPELQEAWASSLPDRRIQYMDKIEVYRSPEDKRIFSDLDILQKAARASTFGGDLESIVETAVAEAQDAPSTGLLQGLSRIASEHGLVGNVFIRESAFTGIHNGVWADEIKKRASRALYILKDVTPSKLDQYENLLGKRVVGSIPWDEAFDHFAPFFTAKGVKVASRGSAAHKLREAFLTVPVSVAKETAFPTPPRPEDSTTLRQAQRDLRTAKASREVVAKVDTTFEDRRVAAIQKIAGWVSAGLLPAQSAKGILSHPHASGEQLIEKMLPHLTIQAAANYSGAGLNAKTASFALTDQEQDQLLQSRLDDMSQQRLGREKHLASAKINALVTSGVLAQEDATAILSQNLKSASLVKLAYARVSQTLPDLLMPKTVSYGGVCQKPTYIAPKDALDIRKASKQMLQAQTDKALSVISDLCAQNKLTFKTAKDLLLQHTPVEAMEMALEMASIAPTAQYVQAQYTQAVLKPIEHIDLRKESSQINQRAKQAALDTLVRLCQEGSVMVKEAQRVFASSDLRKSLESLLQRSVKPTVASYASPTGNREDIEMTSEVAEFSSDEFGLVSEGSIDFNAEEVKQASITDITLDGMLL